VEARLKVLTRRQSAPSEPFLHVGNLVFDLARYELNIIKNEKKLTLEAGPKTLHLIELLMREPGHIFQQQRLENALWHEPQPNSDRLRQTLYQARKLIATPDSGCEIKTVHGLGYRLETTL
jgi:DNA-binding response OmpR family regulator